MRNHNGLESERTDSHLPVFASDRTCPGHDGLLHAFGSDGGESFRTPHHQIHEEKVLASSCRIAFLINNSICILSSFVLMQINHPATILLGRFMYGWTIACHSIWMPILIRQILPASLHNHIDSAFSVAKVFAIMIGYLIGLSCYLNGVPNYYRLMFCIPGIMATVQLVLMFFFVPHSPT